MQAAPEPRSGDKIDLNTLNGSLLHIVVHEVVHDIDTTFGKSDAVRGDVAVLDGANKGQEMEGVLFFPRVLRSQLEQAVGESVVGRLGQGEAKPGKSAPWRLNAPTAEDMAIGERYEAYAAKRAAEQEAPF